jgi:basic membrane protein A and related proteins
MRFRRNLMGVGALAVSLGLMTVACGSDNKSSSDTTSGGAATTSGGAATTAGGEATTTGGGGATTAGGGGGTGTCKSGSGEVPPIQTGQADGKGKKVGLLFDVTGRGDKSFNDAAAAGLDKAKADYGITGTESTPTAADGSDRPPRIKEMAGNQDLIVAVGFLWGDSVAQSAAENPNQKYAIVDSVVHTIGSDGKQTADTLAPNVRSMTFAEQEGSFLVGVAAACASKSGKLGFIGGVENDLIKKFEAGFTAGAKAVNPDATVEVKYITQPPDFTGFNDPSKGKAIAAAMYGEGIDVIYAAAGGSGKGLFEAVVETGKKPGEVYAIGVDSDQYLSASADQQPYILTSALKRVDVATYEAITDALNGKLTGEQKLYDLKNNGVGYAVSNKDINSYAGTIEEFKQKIISGDIKVPTTPGG